MKNILLNEFDLKQLEDFGFVNYLCYVIVTKEKFKELNKSLEIREK
jgi:hypothetical protein